MVSRQFTSRAPILMIVHELCTLSASCVPPATTLAIRVHMCDQCEVGAVEGDLGVAGLWTMAIEGRKATEEVEQGEPKRMVPPSSANPDVDESRGGPDEDGACVHQLE